MFYLDVDWQYWNVLPSHLRTDVKLHFLIFRTKYRYSVLLHLYNRQKIVFTIHDSQCQ